jgi:hypothetical protein
MGPRAFTRRIGRNETFNHAGNALAAALAELAIGRVSTRRNLVCGGPSKNPNQDAAMRIGSEAPR